MANNRLISPLSNKWKVYILAASSRNHSDIIITMEYGDYYFDQELSSMYEDSISTDLETFESITKKVDYLLVKLKLEQTYANPKTIERDLVKTWYIDVEDGQVSLTPIISSIDAWVRFDQNDVICAKASLGRDFDGKNVILTCFPILFSLYSASNLVNPGNRYNQLVKTMFCDTVQLEANEFDHTFDSDVMYLNIPNNRSKTVFSGSFVVLNGDQYVARVCIDDTDLIRTTMVSSGNIQTTWLIDWVYIGWILSVSLRL